MKETIKELSSKLDVLKTLEDRLQSYFSEGLLEQRLQVISAVS